MANHEDCPLPAEEVNHAAMLLRVNTFMWAGPRAGRSSSVACLTLFGPSYVSTCGSVGGGVGVWESRVASSWFWFCVWVWVWVRFYVCMCAWGCSNSTSTSLLLLLLLLFCTRKIDCGESWKVARYARGLTCSWSVSMSERYIYVCMYVSSLGTGSIPATVSDVACGLACFHGSSGNEIFIKVKELHGNLPLLDSSLNMYLDIFNMISDQMQQCTQCIIILT